MELPDELELLELLEEPVLLEFADEFEPDEALLEELCDAAPQPATDTIETAINAGNTALRKRNFNVLSPFSSR